LADWRADTVGADQNIAPDFLAVREDGGDAVGIALRT
jgi:hypothetical protein